MLSLGKHTVNHRDIKLKNGKMGERCILYLLSIVLYQKYNGIIILREQERTIHRAKTEIHIQAANF